jgi:hypothetical protein
MTTIITFSLVEQSVRLPNGRHAFHFSACAAALKQKNAAAVPRLTVRVSSLGLYLWQANLLSRLRQSGVAIKIEAKKASCLAHEARMITLGVQFVK